MSKPRYIILFCCLAFLLAGNALAQTDGQYVIKKIVASGETEVHYLAHVYNTTTSEWELQDATSFSPNCLWYSGPTFNLSGTHHNYYFFDGIESINKFNKIPLIVFSQCNYSNHNVHILKLCKLLAGELPSPDILTTGI